MGQKDIEAHHLIDQIESGEMPKSIYPPLHPEAQLTADQKAQLIAGLRATFSN